jgi:hypothetical protein
MTVMQLERSMPAAMTVRGRKRVRACSPVSRGASRLLGGIQGDKMVT